MRLLAWFLGYGLVGATVASGQMTSGCSVTPPTVTRTAQLESIRKVWPPPGQAAYSLVRMNTQVQTLSNGVQITTRTETREWHDAEGRTRTEFRVEHNGEMELQNGSINDPVLRENIVLYAKAGVAQVTRYAAPPSAGYEQRPVDKAFQEAMKAQFQPQRSSRIEQKNETLEPMMIAGECAQGNRSTQVIPAGEVGNDGPIRAVSENWWSPRLGIQLRLTVDDPRQGHIVNEVTELHLEAPDPSVFQPPPEYQVFDLTREPAKP